MCHAIHTSNTQTLRQDGDCIRLLLFSENKEGRPMEKKRQSNKQNHERQNVIQVPQLSGQSGKRKPSTELFIWMYTIEC
jgi:hypothetical protein